MSGKRCSAKLGVVEDECDSLRLTRVTGGGLQRS